MDVVAGDSMSTPQFPPEITIVVLMGTDLRSLLRCQRVCRRWNSLIRDTVELQYRIELDLHQVEDNCPSDMAILDRLELLKRTQLDWRKLDLGQPIPVAPIEVGHVHRFTFSGDMLAYSDVSEQRVILKRVSPDTSEAEQLVWSQPHPVNLRGLILAMNVKQNLILVTNIRREGALTRARVLLWSLSTGETHPLADNGGTLIANVDKSSRLYARSIHIAGAFICMSIPYRHKGYETMTQLLVWNWHTGALQTDLRSEPTGMIVLEQKYIITRGSKALIAGVEPTQGLAILDLGKQSPVSSWITAETCDCLLLLPETLTTKIHTIFVHMPNPQHSLSYFFPLSRHADRLIVVDFEGHSGHTVRALIVYSKLLNKIRTSRDAGLLCHVVPWVEWQDCVVWVSRALGRSRCFRPLQCVAGMRYLECRRPRFLPGAGEQPPAGHDDMPPTVHVMDFNPGRIARVSMGISALGGRESLAQCCVIAEDVDNQELVLRYPHLSQELAGLRASPRRHYCADNLLFDDGVYTIDQASDGGEMLARVSVVPSHKEHTQEETHLDKRP